MASTGGMLMGAHHPAIDAHRPLHAVGAVGAAAQLIEDPRPAAVG
jgi:hypothetical protein